MKKILLGLAIGVVGTMIATDPEIRYMWTQPVVDDLLNVNPS
jgi:hypothetical protein